MLTYPYKTFKNHNLMLNPRLVSISQVGLAACQVGKALGLTVVGTAGTAEGEQLVRDVGGADFVFNHKSKNYLTEMQASTPMLYSNGLLSFFQRRHIL